MARLQSPRWPRETPKLKQVQHPKAAVAPSGRQLTKIPAVRLHTRDTARPADIFPLQKSLKLVKESAVTTSGYMQENLKMAGWATDAIPLQEIHGLVHKAAGTKPRHGGLQEFTAKTTGIMALQVNAGRHEVQGTAKYSPQENPELADEAADTKPLQQGFRSSLQQAS